MDQNVLPPWEQLEVYIEGRLASLSRHSNHADNARIMELKSLQKEMESLMADWDKLQAQEAAKQHDNVNIPF